jgi:hypothetical protein
MSLPIRPPGRCKRPVPDAAIKRRWITLQQGLEIGPDWSGSVEVPVAEGAPRSCPAGSVPEVGASVVRRDAAVKPMEDLNANVCKKAATCAVDLVSSRCSAYATDCWRSQDQEGQNWLETSAPHREAAIAPGRPAGSRVRGFLAGVVHKRA